MDQTSLAELGVRVEDDFGTTVYVLPGRLQGKHRWVAVIPIGIGLFVLAFMLFWVSGFTRGMDAGARVFLAAGLLMAFPAVLTALAFIGVGLLGLYGWTELRKSPDTLEAIERLGPLRWTRRLRRSSIAKFVLSTPTAQSSQGKTDPELLEQLTTLWAETQPGGKKLLLVAYPRVLLKGIGDELGGAADPMADPAEQIPVVEAKEENPAEVERWEQPAKSLIEKTELPDGFALKVPAQGLWKGSGGLFGFSLLWCAFMAFFSVAMVGAVLQGKGPEGAGVIIFPIFILVFWGIGIGVMVAAINMGRREAVLAATGNQLRIMHSNLFGIRQHEWFWTDIRSILVVPSGSSVNDVPLMQLSITPLSGKPTALLTGRTVEELQWIATLLREEWRRRQGDESGTGGADPTISAFG